MLSPELLGKVLQSAPDAIVIVDTAGVILFASRQITTLAGYQPEEVLERSIETLMPQRFRELHLAHRQTYNRDAHARPMGMNLDLRVLHKDGRELPVEISLSPIHDGERLLIAAAIRDVTERKRIQTELKHAREAAERTNLAKSRFLATASHDLRQPLQMLSLLNGTLRRTVRSPVAIEAVAQQGQAIEAMSRLTNALLDISKLESGAIRPDPSDFAVAALFEEMRTEFASVAASKGLELRVEAVAPAAHSDPSLVGQILRNLVSNAIKYTHRGWIQLRSAPSDRGVRLEVADTGIGIPAEQLPHIYEEFYQVGVATNTARQGYGLGLSIVQRLVRLLGVKLEVQSEVGRGSTFSLELPPALAKAVSTVLTCDCASNAARGLPATARILLVDDDAGVRNATAMLLEVEGFVVARTASLSEAVQETRRGPPVDLVVADYHLQKGETGMDVIAQVRALVGRSLGAVLVSGDTSSTLRDIELDEHLRVASKPIRADELLELIATLLPPKSEANTGDGEPSMSAKKLHPVVFVVDDDESVRSSLRFLLKSMGLDNQAFASAGEFLSAYDPAQPGCLVLDVRMPGMSGLELQQQLNLRGAIIPVIFITGHGDIPMAVEAMQHGAHDFLEKPFRDQDLIDRIQQALAKDTKARAALEERDGIRVRLGSLSPREREVLALMVRGKPNKIMAHELGVSQRTLEIHRARVMEKSGAGSLAQLVRMVMDTQPEPER